MDKVVGYNNFFPVSASQLSPMNSPIERSPMVRGHHSAVNKAVEMHRGMVEERNNRRLRRDMDLMAQQQQSSAVDFYNAQQINNQNDATNDVEEVEDAYNSAMIEPATSFAKAATIQSFQSVETDRPMLGEPVPKGSYIDVEV